MGRGHRVGRRAACLTVVLVTAVGCGSGTPASTSSWQSSSDRTLGQAVSGLGTARIVVAQESRNRLPHSYAVVTATDAIDTTSKAISRYLVGQPPDRLHAAHRAVVEALQQASALLVEVRVAVASPGIDRAAARDLLTRIDQLRARLDRLDTAVGKSPGSVGRR